MPHPQRSYLLLAALMLIVVPAQADVLVFADGANFKKSVLFGPNGLPELPGFGPDVNLPSFDVNLGALASAVISWNSTFTVSGDAIDGLDFGNEFSFTLNGDIDFLGEHINVGPYTVIEGCLQVNCDVLNINEQPSDANLNLVGQVDVSLVPEVQTNGPGSIDIDLVLGETSDGIRHNDNQAFADGELTGTWDITFLATYNFTPVPLPPALLLFITALLPFRKVLRRQKTQVRRAAA